MSDPYVDPRTGVLRNLLGITDADELAQAEAHLAAARESLLFQERLSLGHYDLSHLQAVHRHLFGQIYDWAGRLRTVDKSKGATRFALADWIEPQGRDIFANLAENRLLRDLDRGQFVLAAERFLAGRSIAAMSHKTGTWGAQNLGQKRSRARRSAIRHHIRLRHQDSRAVA